MKVKMHDKLITKRKLMRSRNKARQALSEILGKKSKRYRSAIKSLRDAAFDKKREYKELYITKLEHLKLKYREDEQEKIDNIPDEMQDYVSLSIFDREKFDRLETKSYEVTCVGNIILSNEEKSVLEMHPKFCVMDVLSEGAMNFEIELANAKLRIQLQRELDEKLEDEDEVEISPEEKNVIEEEEAKSRLVFNPMTKTFDDRRRTTTN